MNEAWLVALREMRERARSRALWTSLLVTVLAVAVMIVVPGLLTRGGGSRDVGLAGSVPAGLPAAIESQASAVSITVRVHRYPSTGPGEAAVRRGEAEVLVVDATRLEWRRQPEPAAPRGTHRRHPGCCGQRPGSRRGNRPWCPECPARARPGR